MIPDELVSVADPRHGPVEDADADIAGGGMAGVEMAGGVGPGALGSASTMGLGATNPLDEDELESSDEYEATNPSDSTELSETNIMCMLPEVVVTAVGRLVPLRLATSCAKVPSPS